VPGPSAPKKSPDIEVTILRVALVVTKILVFGLAIDLLLFVYEKQL